MKFRVIHIFLILSLFFLIYSVSIYLKPISLVDEGKYNTSKAAEGRLVWQKYNCQVCHQLYGLGGYLGPDLTNVYSTPGKGILYITALIKSGTKQMPGFNLSEHEIASLMEFLRSTDASGSADPRNYKSNAFGMIERNENK